MVSISSSSMPHIFVIFDTPPHYLKRTPKKCLDSQQNLSFSSLSPKGLAACTDLQLAGPGGQCRFSSFLPEKIQAASSDLMPNCFSIEERTCRWTICRQWIISVITTAIALWSSVSPRKPHHPLQKRIKPMAFVTSY